MRKSFLQVDASLRDGGLEEVAEMKRKNPPKKSPIFNVLSSLNSGKASLEDEDTA